MVAGGNSDSNDSRGVIVPFSYFVLAAVAILSYFLGWWVLAAFAVLLALIWLLAYVEDRKASTMSDTWPESEAEEVADPYVDTQGNCCRCGSAVFSVRPGVTTSAEIIEFARTADGWKGNPEALAGWMPAGIYCAQGCVAIHTTPIVDPALFADSPADADPLHAVPSPVRIELADIMRDGGSYLLVFQAVDRSTVDVLMKVRHQGKELRVGYLEPVLTITPSGAWTRPRTVHLNWGQAELLAERMRPLAAADNIAGGGKPRALAMLRQMRLRGKLA